MFVEFTALQRMRKRERRGGENQKHEEEEKIGEIATNTEKHMKTHSDHSNQPDIWPTVDYG